MNTTEYLESIAANFPARDSSGYVVGFYVYAGHVAGGKRVSGSFPTEAEAQEWAAKVVDGHVVCGHVFTASGKIVRDLDKVAVCDLAEVEHLPEPCCIEGRVWCVECIEGRVWCVECGETWPCPTSVSGAPVAVSA